MHILQFLLDVLYACKILIFIILLLIFGNSRYHWVFQNNLQTLKIQPLNTSKDTLLFRPPISFVGGSIILETQFHWKVLFHQPVEKVKLYQKQTPWRTAQRAASALQSDREVTGPRGHRLTQGPHKNDIKRNRGVGNIFFSLNTLGFVNSSTF